MTAPAGYTVRPSTSEDIDAIAALIQAVDRHDEGIVEPVRGHLEDDWADPLFDAAADTLVVTAEPGELAAYASAWGSSLQPPSRHGSTSTGSSLPGTRHLAPRMGGGRADI